MKGRQIKVDREGYITVGMPRDHSLEYTVGYCNRSCARSASLMNEERARLNDDFCSRGRLQKIDQELKMLIIHVLQGEIGEIEHDGDGFDGRSK